MSRDESLSRTYAESKAARLAEYGLPDAIASTRIADQARAIRRLRWALREIRDARYCVSISHSNIKSETCRCARCIATRALKGKR